MKNLQALQNNVEKIYKRKQGNISIYALLLKKIILLETEASEFMNELEEHKYYKQNKKADKDKQKEEFCDCIHALLSIANTVEVELESQWNEAKKVENILVGYMDLKKKIVGLNIKALVDNKDYAIYALEDILRDLYCIAKNIGYTEEDVLIGFVAVYTKNMMRANSDY